MRPSLPQLHLSGSELAACWKSKLLFLAMGVGVTAIVLFRDGNHKVLAQAPKSPVTRSLAQRPTNRSQRIVWVNPQTGNDAKADGSEQSPFRTLTQALQTAQANTVIQLATGTYSTDTGEVFPIVLKSGVTVQGNPNELGQGIVIRGGGSYSSATAGRQNVAVIGASQATLTGVTVTNPTVRGHGLWVETGSLSIRDNTFTNSTNVGVVVTGSSTPLVQNNLFVLNRSGGVAIAGYAQPEIRENIFQRTGSGLTVSENAAPQISSNRISQNRNGIVVEGNAHPILRSNTVEDSERDGLVVIAQAQPDLGTAREPGKNSFFNNRQHDINALVTDQTLPAFGNQFADNRLSGKIDLTGNAPLTSLTTVASAADRLPATHVVQPAAQPPRSAPVPAQSALISSLPPTSLLPNSPTPAQRSAQPVLTSIATATAANPSRLARQSPVQIPVPPPARSQPTGGSIRPIAQSLVQPKTQAAVEIAVPPPQRATSSPALRLVSSRAQPASAQAVAVPATQSVQSVPPRTVNIAVSPPAQPASAQATPQLASVTVAAAASLPRQATAMSGAPAISGAPITIPVPPPAQSTSSSQTVAAASSNTNVLPVPAEQPPLGNTGDMARVNISDGGGVVLAQRENLQYRVVVEAANSQVQSLVQSLVPDAFATTIEGKSMIQIGAFGTRDNAQEAVEMLSRSGLQGIIQPME